MLRSVEVTVLTAHGTPLGIGATSRVVPPRLRRYLLWRDGGCTADGCTSRYRLQPHHITAASQHGPTEPENLVTLCWFHHHTVIHGHGYSIDPNSPPTGIRFHRPRDPHPP